MGLFAALQLSVLLIWGRVSVSQVSSKYEISFLHASMTILLSYLDEL